MTRVVLLSPVWRLVAAVPVILVLVTLPTTLLALFLLPPVPGIVMIRSFVVGTAVPALVAVAILRVFRGHVAGREGSLSLARGDLVVDVPDPAAIVVRPWWIPLPRPGLGLALPGGARVPLRLVDDTLGAALAALDAAGVDTRAARRHPTVVWALGRRRRTWWHFAGKFVGLGVLPASVLFYTHQNIAYGGPWGQYYLESPGAYWTTFAEYWGTTVVLLVSYASYWRGAAEVVVWLVAALAPGVAAGSRRAAEAVCALAYYGGVPSLLALRYLAS